MERQIATVSQINAYIKNCFDQDLLLQNVWVQGEISNFKLHSSGHMYMSLKDSGAVLRTVMFRGDNSKLEFRPENGMQVLVRGRISVYERDGQYQMYAAAMEPAGVGALYMAFAQLKERLEKEGLFANKKPLPRFPQTVGVITSPTGAAVQDILNVLKRRCKLTNIILCPVLVQGAGAAADIAAAVARMNAAHSADVLIVGRGGGSIEDLWAFNEEAVARAVAASEIPVISAVGHETDFTICDFAADLRAPTPSAAAELAVPSDEELYALLLGAEKQLTAALSLSVSRKREKLSTLLRGFAAPQRKIDDLRYTADALQTRLETAVTKRTERAMTTLGTHGAALDALSPLKVLGRGYAVASKDGTAVKQIAQLAVGDAVTLRLHDGSAQCRVEQTEGGTGA